MKRKLTIRLQNISDIATILRYQYKTDDEIYKELRFRGFEEDFNMRLVEKLDENLKSRYEGFLVRLKNENIEEKNIVLDNGELASLLKFNYLNQDFYHVKVNHVIEFQFIFQNEEGKWRVYHPLTEENNILFAEIFPHLT